MPITPPSAPSNPPAARPNPAPANAAQADRGTVDSYQAAGSGAHPGLGRAALSGGVDESLRVRNGSLLHRAYRRRHGTLPLWADHVTRGLPHTAAQELVRHVRLPASLYRDRLWVAAGWVILPEMALAERKNILDRLLQMPALSLEALVVHLHELLSLHENVHYRGWLTARLLQSPDLSPQALVAHLTRLGAHDMDTLSRWRFTSLLCKIPSQDQLQFVDAMRVFFPPGMSGQDRRVNWTLLSLVDETQLFSAVTAAASVVSRWPRPHAYVGLVSAMGRMPQAERAGVVEALHVLSINGEVANMGLLTTRLAETPGPERPRLVQLVRVELASYVQPNQQAAAVLPLVDALASMPAADRESFSTLLHVAGVTRFPNLAYVHAFTALAAIPSGQRRSVARHVASLQRDDLVWHFAHVINAMGRVEEGERAAFVQICLETLYGQPMLSARVLLERLDSIAATPAAERAEHARRLRDAATAVPQPRVDLENVMDHRRRSAAEAVVQRLETRFPNGRMRFSYRQALESHLVDLGRTLQTSEAQQRQQWHAFAQHMASMPSAPGQGPLQALVAAMAEPTPEAPPLEAWAAGLCEFAKAAGFAPIGRPESMADYHAPMDPQATPLASWLGHLQQFAYVPRGSSAAQPALDAHIEAFVAHVRQFEISTLPVLARVRGRTRATELENACRTLLGESRPGDYTAAVLETPMFKRLVGMVWQAIDAAPAQDQANMRHSLVMALAQCIEDDGHRVCGVGQAQRFAGVVEAQTFTPSQKLTALSEDFAKAHESPTPAQVQDFEGGALQEARTLYGADTPDMNAFARLLGEYIRYTY